MTKYVFVTGANKGIGYEIARQLAEKNYHVFLGARNKELGQKAVESLGLENVSLIQVDIADTESILNSVDEIGEVTDNLDLLVNNDGVVLDINILPSELRLETLFRSFEINFLGTFQMIQAFLPLVKEANGGKIVNITTDMSSQTIFDNCDLPQLNTLGYNSSKTAVNSLTLAFGKEFESDGPEIFGVTPGLISTNQNGNVPLGKTPAEGAQVIVKYAISDKSYNGKILNEGGMIPW
ncbi:SDR family NAD(P)-dependent oxidoreductase [Bacillus spongiae]|uniref:SDR family NAD(P)-dependent oxidoreductase n=1 Tax=Bacillus spongiae TaxID=2683610 RepID=A0ABU8HBI4_9BACI